MELALTHAANSTWLFWDKFRLALIIVIVWLKHYIDVKDESLKVGLDTVLRVGLEISQAHKVGTPKSRERTRSHWEVMFFVR